MTILLQLCMIGKVGMSTDDSERILISGGGPVGLLCALLLGRRGISVRLFDLNPCLQKDPRAATTHPATLEVLGDAGLTDDMARAGLIVPIFQFWDRPSGELVAQFDHTILKDDTDYPYVNQCEQFKTAEIIFQRVCKLPNVEVLFSHEVKDIAQREREVEVTVESPNGTTRHRVAI